MSERWSEEWQQEVDASLTTLANNLAAIFQQGGKISSVSSYADDWGYANLSVSFTKASQDDELKIVFGKAALADLVDSEGDVIDEVSLEKAIYGFMENYRVGVENHDETVQKGVIVASWYDKVEKAWLIGYKVNDDEMWEDVKKGEYLGFSFGGKGIRKSLEGGE